MLIKFHDDPIEKERFGIIEGKCFACDSEDSLILMDKKQISQKSHKIKFNCISCRTNFNYIIEE